MPPRKAKVIGPYTSIRQETVAAIGLSKLDTSAGTFGGVVILEFDLEQWFEELRNVQFFNEATIWLFDHNDSALLRPENATVQFNPRVYMEDQVGSDIRMVEMKKGIVAYIDLALGPDNRFVHLAASIPTALLLPDLNPVIEFFTAVLAGSILLLTLISYIVSRYLALPVKALQITQSRLANAQRIARLGHWEWEIDSSRIDLSEHACAILCVDSKQDHMSFKDFIDCAFKEDRQGLSSTIQEAVKTHRSASIEYRVAHQDGSEVSVYQDIEIEIGKKNRIVGTIQNISQRIKNEQRIRKLAYYDAVTGLANRSLLIQLACDAIEETRSTERLIGFIFLDLDHFKRINDTFGHDAGDELLRQVADRLRHCVRLSDTVGTLSEFERSHKTVARPGVMSLSSCLPNSHRPAT
ncbi:MAG: diguanylate cyclase [Gammaproteobacteria bacterium]|nr:diguanylate cyclase [Gammaproteobacteria bacterium]